jgi:CheY-like chemotaxis protein
MDETRTELREVLEPVGFTVVEVADGSDVPAVIQENKPDIVLMDPLMIDSSGGAVIKSIRSDPETSATRVVAVPAGVTNLVRDDYLRLGFNDFVPRPFRDADMLEVIRSLLSLEWIHRPTPAVVEQASTQMEIPPLDHLEALIDQAESGNIRGVVVAAERLAAEQPAYVEFALKITGMAQEFEINKIVDYLGVIRTKEERPNE